MISTRAHAVMDFLIPLGIASLAATGRFRGGLGRLMTVGPVYHLGYTLLTRHEGGLVPVIPMRQHLLFDALGSLSFVGAGTLMREQPAAHRWLAVALGLGELAQIALSDTEPRTARGRAMARR